MSHTYVSQSERQYPQWWRPFSPQAIDFLTNAQSQNYLVSLLPFSANGGSSETGRPTIRSAGWFATPARRFWSGCIRGGRNNIMRPAVQWLWGRTGTNSFLLGHASVQTTERYIGCKHKVQDAVNDRLGISVASDTACKGVRPCLFGDLGDSVLYHSLFGLASGERFWGRL